jgi:hypothetical protein
MRIASSRGCRTWRVARGRWRARWRITRRNRGPSKGSVERWKANACWPRRGAAWVARGGSRMRRLASVRADPAEQEPQAGLAHGAVAHATFCRFIINLLYTETYEFTSVHIARPGATVLGDWVCRPGRGAGLPGDCSCGAKGEAACARRGVEMYKFMWNNKVE